MPKGGKKGKGKDKAKLKLKRAVESVDYCCDDGAGWDGDSASTLHAAHRLLADLAALAKLQPARVPAGESESGVAGGSGSGSGSGSGGGGGGGAAGGSGPSPGARGSWEQRRDAFVEWMRAEHGVDIEGKLRIGRAGDAGAGLFAERAFDAAELLVEVPLAAALSTETALASPLGPVVMEEELLRQVPSLTLALHLLAERADPGSRFAPFLDMLPDEVPNVLYWDAAQLALLRPSPAADKVLRFLRTTAKHYVYVNRLVAAGRLPFIEPVWTWEWFRWAMAAVMSRQNRVPVAGPNEMAMALVPLWDLINHEEGTMSTDFDESAETIRCYAMRAFAAGEEVRMCYGRRGNAELLQFAGFAVRGNGADVAKVTAGFPDPEDPLNRIRLMLLRSIGILGAEGEPPRVPLPVRAADNGVPSEASRRFARVCFLTREELGAALKAGEAAASAPLPEAREAEATRYWASNVGAAVARYDAEVEAVWGSLEALQATPDDAAADVAVRMIATFLIGERQLLEEAAAWAAGASSMGEAAAGDADDAAPPSAEAHHHASD